MPKISLGQEVSSHLFCVKQIWPNSKQRGILDPPTDEINPSLQDFHSSLVRPPVSPSCVVGGNFASTGGDGRARAQLDYELCSS